MSTPPDDQTATLQARTLFVIDSDGALAAVNDIGRPAAPACFVSMTSTAIHYWTTADPDPGPGPGPGLVDALEAWRRRRRPRTDLDGFTGPSDEVLTAASRPGSSRASVYCGPAYRFPASPRPGPTTIDGVDVRECPPETGGSFAETFPQLTATIADRRPVVAAFVDGRPVAVCLSSRTTTEACEAGVETLPEHRGRGLAAAVTALWAERVQASGRTPLYSTSWDNMSSQAVARRLGLVRYSVTMSIYVSALREPTPGHGGPP